jgi:single-stranded-DNA-specific exonuclease
VQNDSSGYVPEIEIDAEIDFADITLNSPDIKQFEPFGPLNMTPVFLTKIKDTGYAKKTRRRQCSFKTVCKTKYSEGIPAIGFGLGNKMELTTNQSPLKRCIVLMKMNGMVRFQ